MRTQPFSFRSLARRIFLFIVLPSLCLPSGGLAQHLRTREEISSLLVLEQLVVSPDGAIAGEVVNRSPNTLRAVQVLVRHVWLWDQETKPGRDDPSRSLYVTMPGEIAPGQRMHFTYKPSPPLSTMPGGRFVTSAAIAGFTEIIASLR
jgi:hypothetical protein